MGEQAGQQAREQDRILIVDDDVDFSRIARAALTRAGFTVDAAYSGEEGRQKARDIRPSLVVLDAMMETQTEGFHVTYDLRNDPDLRAIPILMLTSINQYSYPFRLERDDTWLPVDVFMDKPVSGDRLVAEVTRMLGLSKSKAEPSPA